MRVLIVADDLTGALDSAVALTGAGFGCVVARRPGDVAAAVAERPDVLGVNTASREGGVETAVAAVGRALDAAGGVPEIVFKKVDSRLKGHVAAEVAAVAARTGCRRVLVAPAIPAQGRTVVGGRLTGAGVASPIDVAAAVGGSGLAVEVPDAATDADLDAVLARALDGGPPPLLVGAAGLAAALARRLAAGAWSVPVPALHGPVLIAVGSHDPITLAQIDRLAATGIATVDLAPGGRCPPLTAGSVALVRLVAAEGEVFEPAAAGVRFAAGIARLVVRGAVRTLLCSGGETADAILGALGQRVLVLRGEALPGLPVSLMLPGERRVQLVTKSGGFGREDALVRVAELALSQEGAG